jgi:hypothetical protein
MHALYARNRSILRPVLGLLLLVLPLCLAISCEATTALQPPAPAWVHSARATHDVLAPRFAAYIDADATLAPDERQDLHNLLSDWLLNIEQSEAAISAVGGRR